MMKNLGHSVYLYASEENEAPCDELIPCITKARQRELIGNAWYVSVPFNPATQIWQEFNLKCIEEINKRKQPQDFLLVIAGTTQKPVADANPDLMAVEWGIGYEGVFSKYRVFESYAWMHYIYGMLHENDGKFFDAVIPNFFDPADFPFVKDKSDYFVYMGRLTPRKGLNIAMETCKKLGVKLIIAGEGDKSLVTYGDYIGPVDVLKRGQVLSQARAVFTPTIYIEPFGGVAVEAMLCGTPVITTDWGAYTETVRHCVTGYRCRTLEQFIWAARNVGRLNNAGIRDYAVKNYSLDKVGRQYNEYFRMLLTLYQKGWYNENDGRADLDWLNFY